MNRLAGNEVRTGGVAARETGDRRAGRGGVRPDLEALASESPELIVTCLYAARLMASHSLGTLLSSEVNQWTWLVGTIPIVFAISSGGTHGLPLDEHQRLELLVTAAQSLFAVSILADLGLTAVGATTPFVLFAAQFTAGVTLPDAANRVVILALSGLHVLLAVVQLVRRGKIGVRTARDGMVTPLPGLAER